MKMIWMQRWAGLVVAGAMLGASGGCSRHAEPGATGEHEGHDHDSEGKTAQITAFGERHEIFAEHPLAVAGTPTKFVTHVTDLSTLEPRAEGPVRFVMRLGQEPPIERVEKSPTRAGIYEPMLTFPKAGDWSVSVIVPTDQGEKSIAFPPVKVFADSHAAEQAKMPEPPSGISFLKEQQWKVPTGTELVTKRKLVEQLRLPGTVSPRPGAMAHVTPPVAGRVLLPDQRPMPMLGDKVEAGQVLALIQPSFSELAARFVEAEAEVVRAKLALEQAQLVLDRVQKLAKAEAKSGRELQEAEFARKLAEAKYEAAVALQATYRQASAKTDNQNNGAAVPAIQMRSPIAGTITAQSGAAVGEYITADKPLFTVLNGSTVFIEAHVPEQMLAQLAATKRASYEVPGVPGRTISLAEEGEGRFVFLGIAVDPATRTVPLVYEASNGDGHLRVGQFVNLHVETARVEEALAIPREAVVEEAGRPIAFVELAGETFEKRDIKLGIRDGDWIQVLGGLAEGERVVSKGAFAIRLASVSSALPSHGHAH